MTKRFLSNKLLAAGGIAALLALSMSAANADADHDRDHDRRYIHLSDRPKTIVIDNLDNATFTKGDPAAAALAQGICGDCHSTDYPTTQPKLSCNGWAKEINKMGTTFRAKLPWAEANPDGTYNVTYTKLQAILDYLTANYGNAGTCATADRALITAIPGLQP